MISVVHMICISGISAMPALPPPLMPPTILPHSDTPSHFLYFPSFMQLLHCEEKIIRNTRKAKNVQNIRRKTGFKSKGRSSSSSHQLKTYATHLPLRSQKKRKTRKITFQGIGKAPVRVPLFYPVKFPDILRFFPDFFLVFTKIF